MLALALSANLANSFIKDILVAKKAFEAYLINSAVSQLVNINSTPLS